MDKPILAVAACADFPSLSMTFHVPSGTPLAGGVFEIKRVRNATADDLAPYTKVPGPNCPHCGKDTWK